MLGCLLGRLSSVIGLTLLVILHHLPKTGPSTYVLCYSVYSIDVIVLFIGVAGFPVRNGSSSLELSSLKHGLSMRMHLEIGWGLIQPDALNFCFPIRFPNLHIISVNTGNLWRHLLSV